MVAGLPRAVPTAFLSCLSSVCPTCGQQQVRTHVFCCWQHGVAQEEPGGTAAGVNVSRSKYLIHGQVVLEESSTEIQLVLKAFDNVFKNKCGLN